MNKKSKTMYVVHPGCYGSGAMMLATYEFPENSREEADLPPAAELPAETRLQNQENRDWSQTVVRFPEAFRRLIWSPLRKTLRFAA
ncbi:hypothetical protein K0B96_14365 [Horticoccus luteus]|uniref:Uncharacterized protein n=1 Tax=Horticoccus luteus TaxID=2862869 RepID=A0A8F9TVD1_9BACT|nr:hypothetical protein [Horticoccus luteus]QYM78469.1 hypothetical protein K0B96_14365 [Horticoccus luteus]